MDYKKLYIDEDFTKQKEQEYKKIIYENIDISYLDIDLYKKFDVKQIYCSQDINEENLIR